MKSNVSALIRFRRMGLIYQAIVAGAVFFAAYDLYLFFMNGMSSSQAFTEALLAALIFTSTYYISSVLILSRKIKKSPPR